MTQNTLIRQFQTGDEAGLIAVFNEVFEAENPNYLPMTKDFRDWKYNQRPMKSEVLVITTADNHIVGQMGAQVDEIIYYGQKQLLYITADLCLKPEFRKQKTIQRLLNSLSDQNRLMCGFPGGEYWGLYPRILPGIKNFKLKIFYKPLTDLTQSTHISINQTLFDSLIIDSLWNNKKTEIKIGTIRNWNYLQWAIIDCPLTTQLFLISIHNKVVGYFATRIKDGICSIIDILVLNNYLSADIVSAIENSCIDQGAKEIRLFITDELLQSTILSQGFHYYREDQLVQGGYLNYLDLKNPHTPLKDIYLTWANTDWYLYDEIRS